MDVLHYDVFVIGSGSAGQAVAQDCVEAGMKVGIVDNREYGGTCANRGCDPKKVLLAVGEVVEAAQRLQDQGIARVPKVEWGDLQTFKQSFIKGIPADTVEQLEDMGIDCYHASPSFINDTTLKVSDQQITADAFVIATGMVPRKLEIPGSDLLLTSEDFLSMPQLPKRVAFIGGGYIAMEFAHLMAALGVEVTILEQSERVLSNFDEDLVQLLQEKSEKMGVRFLFGVEVESAQQNGEQLIVHYDQQGASAQVVVDKVFNTTGRVPALEQLQVDKIGLQTDKNGVVVDEYLRSVSHPSVYACGDVASHSLPLTPLSGREGGTVAQNIIHGNKEKADFPPVPSVVFTFPNLASVGMSETEAKEAKRDINVQYQEVADWYNARRVNEPIYAYKTICDADTGRLLGAHLIGPHAGETINLFAMAIAQQLKVEELKNIIFTYPTLGSDIQSMV